MSLTAILTHTLHPAHWPLKGWRLQINRCAECRRKFVTSFGDHICDWCSYVLHAPYREQAAVNEALRGVIAT